MKNDVNILDFENAQKLKSSYIMINWFTVVLVE